MDIKEDFNAKSIASRILKELNVYKYLHGDLIEGAIMRFECNKRIKLDDRLHYEVLVEIRKATSILYN